MGVVGDIRDAMFGSIIKEQAMNDAEFDRALGEWEDNQLNAHLAGEDRWLKASEEAEEAIWGMKLNDLYEMAPEGVNKKIEALVDNMIEHVVQLIIDGEEI